MADTTTTTTAPPKRTLTTYLTNPNFTISLMGLGATLFTYTTLTLSDFETFNQNATSDKEALACGITSMVIFYTGLAGTFLLLGRQRKIGWGTPIILNGIAMIPSNVDQLTEHEEWGFWPLVAGMWIWVLGSKWCERLPMGAAVKKDQAVAVEEADEKGEADAPKWEGPTPISQSFKRDEKVEVIESVEEKEDDNDDAPPTYETFESEEKQALLSEKA